MSSTYVRFEADGRFSYRGNYPVSPTQLGRDIVNTLLSGRTWTDFGLDPYCAIEALRATGRDGKLCFSMQQDDHPLGATAQMCEEFREQARQLEEIAAGIDDSEVNRPYREFGNRRMSETLLDAADKLRAHVGSLALDGSVGLGPLKHRFSLPAKSKQARKELGAVISWHPRARVWSFAGVRIGSRQLGRLIALTLLRGEEIAIVGGLPVSINFLVEMVRITRQHGRFHERLGKPCDGFAPSHHSYAVRQSAAVR